uniref:XPG N-terminal domain-containing protein n=1 Tax=viral metagenome TaxID=1070528 RepID=A0A6C0BLH2_9ZZZZ
MGIKNFGTIIKHATQGVRTATYSQFAGETWAIDASIFCYRFSHNSQTKRPNSHIDGFYQLFLRLLRFKIKPVLVFDGQAPHEKQHTVDVRAKHKQKNLDKVDKLQQELQQMTGATDVEKLILTGQQLNQEIQSKIEELTRTKKNIIQFQPGIYDDIRTLCRLMSIPVLRAPGEADALCAQLYKMGLVQAIMSEDSDILLYGGGRLIRKFGWGNEIELVELDPLLKSLGITYSQFIDLAILCGTDYTANTINGLGPINALEHITQGMTIETIVKQFCQPPCNRYRVPSEELFPYQEARRLITSGGQLENEIQIHPFDISQLNVNELTPLLMEKCHYRPLTIQKHCEQIKDAFVTKSKIRIMLKSPTTSVSPLHLPSKI